MGSQTFSKQTTDTIELDMVFDHEANCNSDIDVISGQVGETIKIYELIVSCDFDSFIRIEFPNDRLIEANYLGGTTLRFDWSNFPVIGGDNIGLRINNLSSFDEFSYFIRYIQD